MNQTWEQIKRLRRLFEEVVKTNNAELDSDIDKAIKNYNALGYMSLKNKYGTHIIFDERGEKEFFYSASMVAADRFEQKAAIPMMWEHKDSIKDLIDSVAKLDTIVKDMKFVYDTPNRKQYGNKSFVDRYYHFKCPCMINGKKRWVKIAFEKYDDVKVLRSFADDKPMSIPEELHYYYHFIESKQIPTIIIRSFEIT